MADEASSGQHSLLVRDRRLHGGGDNLLEIDLAFEQEGRLQFTGPDSVPQDLFTSVDLFLGVVGESVLRGKHLENTILEGGPEKLIFASGSTKTVEFSHLAAWLHETSCMEQPAIGKTPVRITHGRIYDPQSGIDQGGRVEVVFSRGGRERRKVLYLLGELSPVNFMYYGVPTETMDGVLAQLLEISLAMNGQFRSGDLPSPDLYAVDHEIDARGRPLRDPPGNLGSARGGGG